MADSYTGQVLQRSLGKGERGRGRKGWAAGELPFASSTRQAPPGSPRAELAKAIKVRGARQHNLKGIDVEIPRDQMTVCCGPSGSGKTSLAMDTIYAEGQRRYVESLSSYARQFVDKMQKPRLDHIEGLSPAIAIEQKHAGHSPRSTVGTVTEIYDYLRILVSRLGRPYCPGCDLPVGTQTADEIIDKIVQRPAGTRLYLMAPLDIEVGEKYEALWEEMRAAGYVRVRIDGRTYTLDQPPQIDRRRKHRVEVVIDRVTIRPDGRSPLAGGRQRGKCPGQGTRRAPRDRAARRRAGTQLARRNSQSALRLPEVRAKLRDAVAAQFLLQQSVGLVPGLRRSGRADGHEPGGLAPRPQALLGRRAPWPCGPAPRTGSSRDVGELLAAPASRSTFLTISLAASIAGWSCTEPGTMVRHTFPLSRRNRPGEGKASHAVRFQFKGLYPALEEASRVSPGFRGRLEHLVDEVDCTVCGGSRLRDDAAAVRFRDRTIDEICRQPLGKMLARLPRGSRPPAKEKLGWA